MNGITLSVHTADKRIQHKDEFIVLFNFLFGQISFGKKIAWVGLVDVESFTCLLYNRPFHFFPFISCFSHDITSFVSTCFSLLSTFLAIRFLLHSKHSSFFTFSHSQSAQTNTIMDFCWWSVHNLKFMTESTLVIYILYTFTCWIWRRKERTTRKKNNI